MIETINGKAYLKVGDKVYEVGGGSNIITADSAAELPDPATVAEGTIALVPSEGGGGLPVVEISGEMTDYGISCSDAESEALDAAAATGLPAVLKITALGVSAVALNLSGSFLFQIESEVVTCFKNEDSGKWGVLVQ